MAGSDAALARRSQLFGRMELRSSDRSIPSLAGVPRERIRALGTGALPALSAKPTMRDLAQLSSALTAETSLRVAIERLQRDAKKTLALREAVCFWIDWPHRTASTLEGRASHELEEAVIDVAGRGKRNLLASALLEPVGPAPTRAVLALRKPSGVPFTATELVIIQTLAANIAPALDKLIRAR